MAMNERDAKRMANTIVKIKINLSKPLLVLYKPLPSPPPITPPAPAEEFCNKMLLEEISDHSRTRSSVG